MKICKNCQKEFKTFIVVDGKCRSLSNRKHCLDCVPFKGGKRLPRKSKAHREHCALCERDTKRGRRLCPVCVTRVRRIVVKKRAIKLLGGKCSVCGKEVHIASFEFHHRNNDKEFAISKYHNRAWSFVKKEVLKCDLICSNCHRELHSKYDKTLMAEAERILENTKDKIY